jgi:4-hydroxy-tetrahydrodipicolinate synthase
VTGEVARLDDRERAVVLETVVDQVKGRVPVLAGTTADGLRKCIGYTRNAQAAGAAAVMVSPPRLPKLNSAAVVGHYAGLDATTLAALDKQLQWVKNNGGAAWITD